MNNQRKIAAGVVLASASLLAFIGGFEGREHEVYKDIVGVPTVCDGITGPDVVPGKTYTDAECDALSAKHVTKHGEGFLTCVKVPLNQNQYDAFTSLAYNVGLGNVCNSGLDEKPPRKYLIDLLNSGDYTGACERILAYDKVKKRVKGPDGKTAVKYVPVRGLTIRRKKERDLCLTPVAPPYNGPRRQA